MTWKLTHFFQFFPNSVTTPKRLCTPSAPSHPPPPVVSIVLWMKVPLCVWRAEWCMVWTGTDRVPRPRDAQTPCTTHPCCAEQACMDAHRHTHIHKEREINKEQWSKNSPCSWQSSLCQVRSDPLSNVSINIHQCCYRGLTYLKTANINLFKSPAHTLSLWRHSTDMMHPQAPYPNINNA